MSPIRFRRCLRWVAGLFRTQVLDLRCTSILSGKILNQPDLVLEAADEAHIAFTIQYSALTCATLGKASSRLEITLSNAEAESSMSVSACNAPSSSWPVKGDETWDVEQHRAWRRCQVSVRMSRQALAGRERIALKITQGGKHLTTLSLRVIGESQAQRLRFDELCSQNQQLWVQSGQHTHLSDCAVESSASLIPEIILSGADFNAVLPPCETSLSLRLVTDSANIFLGNTPFTLGQSPVRVRASPIPIRNTPIFKHPGRYTLIAAVGGKELAVFNFRFVEKKEWQNELKVTTLLEAETPEGLLSRETGALDWGRHRAFIPSLKIQTTIPAPNTEIKCLVRIVLGETILRREELLLRLTQKSQQVRLQKFSFSELGCHLRDTRVSLLLTVCLDDHQKAARPVLILPAGAVTNFEGQFNQELDTLPVDQEAYDGILKDLRGNHPIAPKYL